MGSYFIKIEDGPEVRRKLLESSKATLHTLKGYHDLVRLRGEKLSHMNQLRRELKELTVLVNRVESLMPQLTPAELEELQPRAPELKPVKDTKPQGKWVKKGSKKVFIAAPTKKVTQEVPVEMPELPAAEEELPKAKPMTELERLQKALEDVDKRLGRL
jgi:hypothetical protein